MVMPTILPLWEDKINWEMKKGLFCQIVGFPHIIGKICLQSTEFDAGNGKHPAQIEAKIMTKICKTKGEKTKKVNKYLRFLPQIVFEKTMPVWSQHLVNLPMRRFVTDIHTHCNIILTPKYHCNLLALQKDKNETITFDEYRYIIFGVLYSLLMLQKQYGFVHGDLHAENILLRHRSEASRKDIEFTYHDSVSKRKMTWRIPAEAQRYTPILWDFENARLFNDDELNNNPMSENQADVPSSYCDRYDAHYFLTELVELIPENLDAIPGVIRDWVNAMYADDILPNSVKNYHDTVLDYKDDILQESKHHVKALLENEMFPEHLKLRLEDYCTSQWGTSQFEESDEEDSDQDDTDFNHNLPNQPNPEDFYDENDGYYDYLMSQYPKDGVMWPTRLYQLNVQSKTDLRYSDEAAIVGNRLSNSYRYRNDMPTPLDLLTSSLFQDFLCEEKTKI